MYASDAMAGNARETQGRRQRVVIMDLFIAFICVVGGTGLLCLATMGITRLVLRFHPEWVLSEEEMHPENRLIRREQAKFTGYSFPAEEVDMRPSNCDV